MVKTCPICGKEFATKNEQQKYCSAQCRRKNATARESRRYRAQNPLAIRACPGCSKEFTPTHGRQKYCSRKCYYMARTPVKWTQESAQSTHVLGKEFCTTEPAKTIVPDSRIEPKTKIYIAQAAAEKRTPTTEELLDWIFDPDRKKVVDTAYAVL